MRKEIKLAFESLDKEFEVIQENEMQQILGGDGLDDIVSYFENKGFHFSLNSSGNLYWSSSGMSSDLSTGSSGNSSTGSTGSTGGGSGSPQLPNGDCIFNMVAQILDGNTNHAADYKTDLMATFTFTEKTLSNGSKAYSYDPDDIVNYFKSKGKTGTSYDDTPTPQELMELQAKEASFGISSNGHNYTVKKLVRNGQELFIYDPTNPNNGLQNISIKKVNGVYSVL